MLPCAEGRGAYAKVPDDGGEELGRENVDCPVRRGDGHLAQHGQDHQPDGLDRLCGGEDWQVRKYDDKKRLRQRTRPGDLVVPNPFGYSFPLSTFLSIYSFTFQLFNFSTFLLYCFLLSTIYRLLSTVYCLLLTVNTILTSLCESHWQGLSRNISHLGVRPLD